MSQELMLELRGCIDKPVDEVSNFGTEFRNGYGSIRKCFVNDKYTFGGITKENVVDLYREWRDDAEYFVLRKKKKNIQKTFVSASMVNHSYIHKFIKGSKRGNDVSKSLVEQRLKPLNELPNLLFFEDNTVDKRTSALFVTLTFDTKKSGGYRAWENIGKEFHLFHNNLRKQYGSVEIFRTWESTDNYYPHVHMIILFWDKSFPVFTHKDKDGKVTYRIPYKEKKKISKYWHSNIDVQAISDTQGAMKELTKYITKDLCSEKGDKTNSMIWVHGKQGYSISKGFIKAICGWALEFNEPTNADLIKSMCNCNQDIENDEKWEFVGILRGKHLGFDPNIWCVDVEKPPPAVAELIKYEQKRWAMVHGGR